MTSPLGADPEPDAARSWSRTWRSEREVDLALTLRPLSRGRFDPTMRWDAGGVWRTLRTPVGPATLHLTLDRSTSTVDATAWGDGAQWALDGVPQLLGEGDDDDGFDVSANAFLADVHRRMSGLRLLRVGVVFEMLVPAILEQKVTSVEARRSWRTLVSRFGEAAPGPAPDGMRVFPTSRQWALIPSWEWHRAGVDPKRSRTVLAAASVAPGLERTLSLGRGGDDLVRKICSVPGVGVWTSAETTQRSHGDPDAVSVGDYHLPALVGWALIGEPVDDDGMLELLDPWRGHRQRVMRLIESSGFSKPKFGPRMTIQDHRGH